MSCAHSNPTDRADAKSRNVRAKRGDAVSWETAVPWLQAAAEPAEAEDGGKVFIERSKAVALLLQQDDLTSLIQQLGESTVQENPATEFSPFSLQPYLAPEKGVRYVVVYMMSDHGTACEAFPASYGSRYLDVAMECPPAKAEPLPAVNDAVLLELRHTMLSMVAFMRKAHDLQCDSLVCEFVQQRSTGQLLFHGVLGTALAGQVASWTSSYDTEAQLVRDLVEKIYAKQPAMKVFNRSSMLPDGGAGPMPSPGERVKYRQKAQAEVDQLLRPPQTVRHGWISAHQYALVPSNLCGWWSRPRSPRPRRCRRVYLRRLFRQHRRQPTCAASPREARGSSLRARAAVPAVARWTARAIRPR